MKLHEDKYSFLALMNQLHDKSGIRPDILEKDYYVTLLLKELSEKQENLPAYFKGGTALYKAQKSIRRFSEDIDLTVDVENCSNSQAEKRLEQATKKYNSLSRTQDKELEDDRKGSITIVYDYDPVVSVDDYDPLQRFRHVKVEATSMGLEQIQDLMNDSEKFLKMISYKRLEETRRTGSDLDDRQFKDFEIFDGISSNTALVKDYNKMQDSYVFNSDDRLAIEYVMEKWMALRTILLQIDIYEIERGK